MKRSSLALLAAGPAVLFAVWFGTGAAMQPGAPALGEVVSISAAVDPWPEGDAPVLPGATDASSADHPGPGSTSAAPGGLPAHHDASAKGTRHLSVPPPASSPGDAAATSTRTPATARTAPPPAIAEQSPASAPEQTSRTVEKPADTTRGPATSSENTGATAVSARGACPAGDDADDRDADDDDADDIDDDDDADDADDADDDDDTDHDDWCDD